MARRVEHPYERKVNRLDEKELELLEEYWDSDMSEAEWMALCNRRAGKVYHKYPRKGKKHESE